MLPHAHSSWAPALVVLAALAVPAVAAGAEEASAPSSAGRWEIFPGDHLYAPYTADPHRLGFGLVLLRTDDDPADGERIADAGANRFQLRVGGRLGLLRRRPREAGGRAWQLEMPVGFDAQFDSDHSLDNLGWDGNYGLLLTSARDGGAAFEVGILHTSAHVGDELQDRTGRRRIGYTREELVLGLRVPLGRRWQAYAEGGWGYELRNEDLQEPGRVQAGVEYEVPGSLGKGRWGWYAATDFSATEERDWRLDVAVQAGVVVPSAGRTWRLGIEIADGRPPISEFFQATERWIAFGIWMDP